MPKCKGCGRWTFPGNTLCHTCLGKLKRAKVVISAEQFKKQHYKLTPAQKYRAGVR